ncbi:enoyl-CoA hydratase-related protein [Streptomyces sp. NPDC049879]|uniref:enoyl-CoA hydratase-related protein n=1 Tax=Streptomyces sp. NPDC049879 TaxID=3365598 RepID=UPI0037A01960
MPDWHRDPDGIVTLTLADPGDPDALTSAADRLAAEAATLRGVILVLAGDAFLTGDPARLHDAGPDTARRVFDAATRAARDLRRIETLGRPVVAALGGDALGGVLETALACHRRVAVDAPGSRVGLPGVRLGLLPGGGGVTRTVRLLGIADALRHVLLDGAPHTPARAFEIGLVDELARDHDDMTARARAWIDSAPDPRQPWDTPGHRIPGGTPADPAFAALLPSLPALLRRRTGGAPAPAPRAILAAAVEGAQVDLATAVTVEARYAAEVAAGPVAADMVRAFHTELAAVRAAAPRPAAASGGRIAVLGTGARGEETVRLCAEAGADVAVGDPAGCDIVLVTGDGDAAGTGALLRRAEESAVPGALLCATGPVPPLADLAKELRGPHALVGLRLHAVVDGMPLAEIVRGAATDDAAAARAGELAVRLGRTPLVVRGPFADRLTGRFLAEGLAMVAEGVPAPSIEQAAAQAGFPTPVLALADELGPTLLPACAVLDRMSGLGRPGRAAGAGFHEYAEGRRTRLWPGLREHFERAGDAPPFADLRERLLLAPVIEALRLLDEGVVSSAADADIGSLLGAGFPTWTGGVIRFALSQPDFAAHATRHGERFTPPPNLPDLLAHATG